MKTLTAALLLFATAAHAGDPVMDRRDQAACEDAIAVSHGASRIAPSSVRDSRAEYWMIIPAAASSAGSRGTFYRSDVMIANFRNVQQTLRARWIPQNQSGFSTDEVSLKIPPNSVVAFSDFVGTVLKYSGLGAIEFSARTAGDSLDTDAKIDVFSRIWTPQPGTTLGSVSQNFGANYYRAIDGSAPAYAIGLRQDGTFRTNVGIVNFDFFDPHTWRVTIIGTLGTTTMNVSVPAFSMTQVNIPAGNWGDLSVTFTPDASMTSGWMAYATSSDNGTNDGWVSPATQTGQ